MDIQDTINQSVWSDRGALDWMAALQGFTDSGERAAYARIADEMRLQPILDLGVGAGRTIPLLCAISPDYVAIDYQPAMVDIAKNRYPDVCIQLGDARDLSGFSDNSFSLVVFSHSGIDAVDHYGRSQIFREASRVLKSQGVFWFSTLNLDGAEPDRRPWAVRWPDFGEPVVDYTVAVLRALKSAALGTANFFRLKQFQARGDGWLVAPFFAHDYGLLTHYTTLPHLRLELEKFGFDSDIEVIDPNGRFLRATERVAGIDFFNILARKAHR